MDQYGHLLDDDDELPGNANKGMGQIMDTVKELGKDNIEQLMALADDDDELDMFMNQMKEEKMFQEPLKDEPQYQQPAQSQPMMQKMYEKPSYQRILDQEKSDVENNGKTYVGPSDEVLQRCGIPLDKKKFIEKERNQILFAGGKYNGPTAQLLNNIDSMTEETFTTMFTKPNVNQRFIDRERNEALMKGLPDPYPV
jgi:hypothetical protein